MLAVNRALRFQYRPLTAGTIPLLGLLGLLVGSAGMLMARMGDARRRRGLQGRSQRFTQTRTAALEMNGKDRDQHCTQELHGLEDSTLTFGDWYMLSPHENTAG